MRGYSAVGLHHPKTAINVGSALRAAQCYVASKLGDEVEIPEELK